MNEQLPSQSLQVMELQLRHGSGSSSAVVYVGVKMLRLLRYPVERFQKDGVVSFDNLCNSDILDNC